MPSSFFQRQPFCTIEEEESNFVWFHHKNKNLSPLRLPKVTSFIPLSLSLQSSFYLHTLSTILTQSFLCGVNNDEEVPFQTHPPANGFHEFELFLGKAQYQETSLLQSMQLKLIRQT